MLLTSKLVTPGGSDVPQGRMMSTPSQSSHQAGLITSEQRVSEKAIKSASFWCRKMERRVCDSEFKHRKNSGYWVMIAGLIPFEEEEEEEASGRGTNEIMHQLRNVLYSYISLLLELISLNFLQVC
uniref:Uncharacterized protein n=1 Tax=Populus davidiana TaxID=266767 RepID=A0A6M2EDB0_9ROSI